MVIVYWKGSSPCSKSILVGGIHENQISSALIPYFQDEMMQMYGSTEVVSL